MLKNVPFHHQGMLFSLETLLFGWLQQLNWRHEPAIFFTQQTLDALAMIFIVQQPMAIYLANPVSSDNLWIIYLLDVYNKIQVGVELLPLGNSRSQDGDQHD